MNYKKFENKSSAKYGRFGDHVSNSGRVVKGINNDNIHIEGGVESDIWDIYSKQSPQLAENILATRKGITPSEASINPLTGNREYFRNPLKSAGEWLGSTTTDFIEGATDFLGDMYKIPGNILGGIGAAWDRNIADPFQQEFEIGEYDPENIMKNQLGDMLEPSIANVIKGTKEMRGFLDKKLEGEMDVLGEKRQSLWEGVSTAQDKIGANYQNIMNTGASTGLATTAGQSEAVERLEKQGDLTISGVGREQRLLKFQQDQLGTQLDIDKLQADIRAQETISSILGDYMAATGEPIGDEFVDLLEEINEKGVSGVDYG